MRTIPPSRRLDTSGEVGRVGQAAGVEVVAEEDDGGVVAGLAEAIFEQLKGAVRLVGGKVARVADEEDLVGQLRSRHVVFPVVVKFIDIGTRRGAGREGQERDEGENKNPGAHHTIRD